VLAGGDVRRLSDTAAAFAMDNAPMTDMLARTSLCVRAAVTAQSVDRADTADRAWYRCWRVYSATRTPGRLWQRLSAWMN
jgi:hypothetical protein